MRLIILNHFNPEISHHPTIFNVLYVQSRRTNQFSGPGHRPKPQKVITNTSQVSPKMPQLSSKKPQGTSTKHYNKHTVAVNSFKPLKSINTKNPNEFPLFVILQMLCKPKKTHNTLHKFLKKFQSCFPTSARRRKTSPRPSGTCPISLRRLLCCFYFSSTPSSKKYNNNNTRISMCCTPRPGYLTTFPEGPKLKIASQEAPSEPQDVPSEPQDAPVGPQDAPIDPQTGPLCTSDAPFESKRVQVCTTTTHVKPTTLQPSHNTLQSDPNTAQDHTHTECLEKPLRRVLAPRQAWRYEIVFPEDYQWFGNNP